MPIDWRREVRPETVADLIARKKYARAIELVQRRLETEPTSAVRLQLANLLAQAGRGTEAVPLFMSLADEFAAEGFLARAVAALKRVDRIEPGRNDVESRLQTLAREQAATVRRRPLGARPPAAPPVQKAAPEPAPAPHPEPEPPTAALPTPEPPLTPVLITPVPITPAPLFLESPPEPPPPESRGQGRHPGGVPTAVRLRQRRVPQTTGRGA